MEPTAGRKIAAALVALLLGAQSEPAPLPLKASRGQAIEWRQVFATPGDDWVNDLVPLRNGNVLAVGFLGRRDGEASSDWLALAAELSPDGAIVSDHRYGAKGGIDAFWSAAEAGDGKRVFAGFTTRIGPAGINGLVLVSGADGKVFKENGLGHPGYDRFTDLAATDGGFLFLGHSQLPDHGAPRRAYLVKTDAAGLPLWERIFGGPETWSALYIEPTGDGSFVIAGGTDGGGDSDMFVLKVDAEGRELWRRRVGTADWDEINHGLEILADGRIVLIGYAHARESEQNDLVAATLSNDGQVQRLERFGGTGDDRAINGRADASGLVWIIGQTGSAGMGGNDLLLTAFDPDRGFTGGAMTLGGASDDHGTVVHPLGGGALLIAGYSRGLGGDAQDAFVAKLGIPGAETNKAFRQTVIKAP